MDIQQLKVMLADLLKFEAAAELERFEPAMYYSDDRDTAIKERAAALYERYSKLARALPLNPAHEAVPPDVASYVRRLRPLARKSTVVRVFCYVTLRECILHRAQQELVVPVEFAHPNGDRRDRWAA